MQQSLSTLQQLCSFQVWHQCKADDAEQPAGIVKVPLNLLPLKSGTPSEPAVVAKGMHIPWSCLTLSLYAGVCTLYKQACLCNPTLTTQLPSLFCVFPVRNHIPCLIVDAFFSTTHNNLSLRFCLLITYCFEEQDFASFAACQGVLTSGTSSQTKLLAVWS